MNTNQAMVALMAVQSSASLPFPGALARIASSPFLKVRDASVLTALYTAGCEDRLWTDATGFEAIVNKVHIEDYCIDKSLHSVLKIGVEFARRIASRLDVAAAARARVVLGADEEFSAVVVRYFLHRSDQEWMAQDINAFTEPVAVWDVGCLT
jgi:hypothetical protein